MHRHHALRPLSRGHQPILMHARDLRWRATYVERGDGHLQTTAFARFRDYAESGLEAHLRAEEEHLLCRLEAIVDADLREALSEDRDARQDLRGIVAEVTVETPDGLRRLGDALERHARHCERSLFPIVERVLVEAELQAVHDAIGMYQV